MQWAKKSRTGTSDNVPGWAGTVGIADTAQVVYAVISYCVRSPIYRDLCVMVVMLSTCSHVVSLWQPFPMASQQLRLHRSFARGLRLTMLCVTARLGPEILWLFSASADSGILVFSLHAIWG